MSSGTDLVRSRVPWMKDLSDDEILQKTAELTGKSLPDTAAYLGYEAPSSMMGKELYAGGNRYLGGFGHIGAAMGIPGAAEYAKAKEDRAASLQGLSTAPHSWEEVKVGDSQKGLLPYAGQLFAGSAPYAAEAAGYTLADIATGGMLTPAIAARYAAPIARAGITAPKVLGGQGLEAGASYAARRGALEAAEAQAPGIARTMTLPAVTYPSALGDTLGNQFEESGKYDLPSAALAAAPYAAANVAGLEGAVTRGVFPKLGLQGLEKNLLGRSVSGGLATAAGESGGETFQEMMNQAARMGVNPNAEMFSPEALARYKESAIAGGIMGGLPGAVGGIRAPRQPLDKNRPADLTKRIPDNLPLTEYGPQSPQFDQNEYEQTLYNELNRPPAAPPPATPGTVQPFTQEEYEAGLTPTQPGLTEPFDVRAQLEGMGARGPAIPPTVPAGSTKGKAVANAIRDAAATAAVDPKLAQVTNTNLQLRDPYIESHLPSDHAKTPNQIRHAIRTLVGDAQTVEEAAETLRGKIVAMLGPAQGKGSRADRDIRAEKMIQFYDNIVGTPEAQRMSLDQWRDSLKVASVEAARATAAASAKVGQEGQVPGAVTSVDPATLATKSTAAPVAAGVPAKPTNPAELPAYQAAIKPHLLAGVKPEELEALQLIHGLKEQNAGDEEAVTASLRAAAKESGIPHMTLADRAGRAITRISANAEQVGLPVEAAQALLGMQTNLDVHDIAMPSGAYEGTQAVRTTDATSAGDDFQETAGYEPDTTTVYTPEGTVEPAPGGEAAAPEGEGPDAAVEQKQRAEFENKWVDAQGRDIAHADVQDAQEEYDAGRAADEPAWAALSPRLQLQWVKGYIGAYDLYPKPKQELERGKYKDKVREQMLDAGAQEQEQATNGSTDDGKGKESADDAGAAQGVGREVGVVQGAVQAGTAERVPPAAAGKPEAAGSKGTEKPASAGQAAAPAEKVAKPAEPKVATRKKRGAKTQEAEKVETSRERAERKWGEAEKLAPQLGNWWDLPYQARELFVAAEEKDQTLADAAKIREKYPDKWAYEEKPDKSEPAEMTQAKRDVIDAMNKKLTVDALIDKLVKTSLTQGQKIAITERFGDDMSPAQQRRMLGTETEGDKKAAEAKPKQQRAEWEWDENHRSKSPTTVDHLRSKLKAMFRSDQQFDKKVTVVNTASELPFGTEIPAEWEALLEQTTAFVDPRTRHVYMIADRIPKGGELSLFLHEMGVHAGMENLIGIHNMVALSKQVEKWAGLNDGSLESKLAKRAIWHVGQAAESSEKAGVPLTARDYMEETIAYFISYAVDGGINPLAADKTTSLGKWFDTLWGAVKEGLRKMGIYRFDTLTAQDIVDLAFGAARKELEGEWRLAPKKGVSGFQAFRAPVQKEATKYLTNVRAAAQKHGLGLMITEDIADLAAADNYPEVRAYVEAAKAREGARVEFEAPVAKVTALYDALPEKERGVGPDSVNQFIQDATIRGDTDGINRLSASGQALVKAVFKHGSDMLALKKKLIEEEVGREFDERIAEATDEAEKAGLRKERASMLKQFSGLMTVKNSDTYAPLKRFGDYVVSAKSQEYLDAEKEENHKWIADNQADPAHVQVHFTDTQGEADALVAEINQGMNFRGGEVYGAAREGDIEDHRDLFRAFPVLQRRLETESPAKGGVSPMGRIIRDLYLQALAEASARKSEMRRHGIAGASTDMMRAFATQGRADAHFLASLKHNDALQDAVQDMREGAKRDRRTLSPYMVEMLKRHQASYEHHSAPWASKMKRAASLWMLATNPTYYLQQLVQPWAMSLPVIAGKQGYFRTVRALRQGYSDVTPLVKETELTGQLDWSKAPADVRDMLKALSRSGAIDAANTLEQGEFKLADKGKLGAGWNRVDAKLRGLNTRVEAVNRSATAIAAYRMELAQNGGNKEEAARYAEAMVRQTHGSYDGSNTPRYMQSPVMQVVSQFRRFQIIQLSLIARLAHNAFRGSSAEEKALARRALTYTLLHTGALGGTLGMPGAMLVTALVARLFGPDDEPPDFEKWAREAIGDQAISDLLLKGVPAMLGVDLSSKLGMGQILSINAFADFPHDRESAGKYALGLLGPVTGLSLKAADGFSLIYQGQVAKAAEQLLPTGFSNAMKGYRLASEGVTMRSGDTILSKDEIGLLDATLQGLGMPTSTITHQRRLADVKFEFDTYYKERTTELIRDYQQARKAGESTADVMKDWNDMQEARVRNGYTRQPVSTLLKSAQAQAKRERATAGGVEFTKANKRFVQEQANL